MSKREVPFWPTCIQGLVVISTTILGAHWLDANTTLGIAASIGIAFAAGLLFGYVALNVSEWFYHSYAESVETKSRSAFTSVIIALAALAIATVSFAMQWHKVIA